MRILVIILVSMHGIAHLVGFLVPWGFVKPENGHVQTTILANSVEVGITGARLLGVGWLLIAIAFGVLSAAIIMRAPIWTTIAPIVVVASLLFCVLGWPDARLGILANIVIGALLIVGLRFGWLPAK